MKSRELDERILEYERDLVSFKDAFDILEDRARQRAEEDFLEWPGYIATKNVLIMSIVRLEGLLEDLRTNKERAVLRLVGDEDER